MESEKVKVIKEYLRCMRGEKACWDCGLNEIAENQDTCCINLVADMALDLINDLESENAYKQEHIELWFRKNEEKKKRIDELEKENEILQGTKDKFTFDYRVAIGNKALNEVKSVVLPKFAERLKSKDCSVPIHKGFILIEDHAIDETLKEFCQKTQQKEREND